MPGDIEKLKDRINYRFVNRELLKESITHRSYAAEAELGYDNQRLEFLGDAVLEIILTEYIFRLYPESGEGELTKIRSALVREETLAAMARQLGLGEYIRMGRGELAAGGNCRDSTLADLYEAVLGAIFLDGGIDPARAFVMDGIGRCCPSPRELLRSLNPKGELQEYTQRRFGCAPEYFVMEISGPEHSPQYLVEARCCERRCRGVAHNRKSAESVAAAEMLEIFCAEEKEGNS